MRRYFGLLIVLLTAVFLFSGCGEKPVAQVNGEKLTTEEFNHYLEQSKAYAVQNGADLTGDAGKKLLSQLKQDTADRWVEETLVFQAGAKEKITLKDEEVNTFLDEQIKKTFETDAKYQAWLTSQKMTEKDLLRLIRYQLTGQKLYDKLTGTLVISDAKAQETYDKDKTVWEKIKVSHILVSVARDTASKADLAKAKAKAMGIIGELKNGGKFADLAKKYSDDTGSAAQGGALDMEFTRQEQGLVPEFVEGSFKLTKVGGFSQEPVLSEFGYHIIRLDAMKGSFADVKDDIKNQLLQDAKNTAFQKYLDDFKKGSKISTAIPEEASK